MPRAKPIFDDMSATPPVKVNDESVFSGMERRLFYGIRANSDAESGRVGFGGSHSSEPLRPAILHAFESSAFDGDVPHS